MTALAARGDGTDRLVPGLLLVGSLACFAGAVDALGLSFLSDLFVSFMSGNTTSLGLAIGRHDLPRVALILSLIGTFVSGAAGGTVLAHFAGRYRLPVLVAADALILMLPIPFPAATILSMTFAMGVLNAAMEQAGSVSVSITYITGTLVKLGRGLGLWICGQQRDFAWLEQGVPWIGLLIGAVLGTLCLARFGVATIHWLPAVAATLSLVSWIAIPRRHDTSQHASGDRDAELRKDRDMPHDYNISAPQTGVSFYAALVPFSIACFVLTLLTDLAYWATASFLWETASVWLLAAGLVVGGLAILAAIVDLVRTRSLRGLATPWPAALGQAAAFVLSLVNVFVHSRDGYTAVVPQGLILSTLVVIVLLVTTFVGRSVVHGPRVGGLA